MVIYSSSGPIGQLANVCFLFAALFSDLILIRLFLFLAYVFLFAYGATGLPQWPQVDSNGNIALDRMIWSAAIGTLHFVNFLQLLWDERPIKFRNEDEEQLWRFFYRRGGMGRLEVNQILKMGRFERFKPGEMIVSPHQSSRKLCILIEGIGVFAVATHGGKVRKGVLYSGQSFDITLMSIFGVYLGFETDNFGFTAIAENHCLVFTLTIDQLDKMAVSMSPTLCSAWRSFALCQLGLEMCGRQQEAAGAAHAYIYSLGDLEPLEIKQGARSMDFVEPLHDFEKRSPSVYGFFYWIYKSFTWLMPVGVRHTTQPVTGMLARNRLKTYTISKERNRDYLNIKRNSWTCRFEQKDLTREDLFLRATEIVGEVLDRSIADGRTSCIPNV